MGRKVTWPPRITVHSQTGQARVRHLGQTYYLGRAGSPEARRKYVELLQTLTTTQGTVSSLVLSVGECCRLWLAHAQERYGERQEALEHHYATAPVLELFDASPASEFDASRLEDVRDRMIAQGLCRNVINRRIVRIRTAWRWLERRGHVPKGSWAGLRVLEPLGPTDRRVRATLPVRPADLETVEAVRRLLPPVPSALLATLWHTGARPSELFSLRIEDLDRSGEVWTYRPAQHKCAWRGQERLIVFGPQAVAILAPLLEDRGSHDLVFPNARGGAFTMRTFGQAIARKARKAGVRLHSYQCRHSARINISKVSGIDAARAMLGQRTLDATLLYGVSGDEDLAKDAARRCG